MEPTRLRLGELLVDARIITPEQLAEVLEVQKADGRRLGILLVERGMVNETQLTQILSQQLSVPWVSLYHVDFSKRLLSMVPRDVASKYCLVPIYVRHVRGQGDTLYVAMYDPTNVEALRICAAWSGLPTRAMIASPSDIRNAIEVYYGPAPEDQAAAQEASETGDEQPAGDVSQEPPPAPAVDGSSVAVSPEQAPAEERFAGEARDQTSEPPATSAAQPLPQEAPLPRAEEPREAHASEPPGAIEPQPAEQHDAAAATDVVEQQPAEQEADAPSPHYDDSVSVEVGREVPLDELISRRPVPASADEPSEAAPEPARTKSGRMLALTLLDGTTLALPMNRKATRPRRESLVKSFRSTPEGEAAAQAPVARQSSRPPSAAPPSTRPPPQELPPVDAGLTGRDVVAALRAAGHGVDPTEILGSHARWETMMATVLSLMLRKGLITDEELAEELKKI